MFKIAIDGPSGAGKSSVAKALAEKIGIVYVDTGALYRAVGYYIRSVNADPKSAEQVVPQLKNIDIGIRYENGTQFVYLNGENLGEKIREPEISMYASAVSAIPEVRKFLLETQKSVAKSNNVVMDGRDIGTVILPDADVKIFLVASVECRAERRVLELEQKGISVKYEDVLREMVERDSNDKNRDVAPAIPADDAVILDNSELTMEETLEKILEIAKTRIDI